MDTFERKLLKNPRAGANFFSVLTFAWTWPLFWKGARKDLGVEDLQEPLKEDSSARLGTKLEKAWYRQVERAKRKGTEPSLLRAVVATFWKEYAIMGVMQFTVDIGLRLIQPLMLGQLLNYFAPGSTMPNDHAVLYAAGIVGCMFLSVMISNNMMMRGYHTGMQVRVACCSLIYRKAIRLSRTALGNTASGQVVNLLSNDVSRFDIVSMFVNQLWCAPLLTIVISALLYNQVGWTGFVGIAAIFVVVPLQSYTGKLSSKFRYKTALRTDARVRLMDEIINGVQVIKMYAWEKPFGALIALARRKEIKEITKVSFVRGVFMTFVMFTTRMALFATLVTYVLVGDRLKASNVFVIQSYFSVLSMSMGSMFVRGVSEVAECSVSLGRLKKFMMYEEYDDQEGQVRKEKSPCSDSPGDAKMNGGNTVPMADIVANGKLNNGSLPASRALVKFTDVNCRWLIANSDDTLKNINLTLNRGDLLAVIGPVGSGKTSLLQSVLGELAVNRGKLEVNAKVSYASQEPWLFAASVRQNIVFGSQFDRKRYDAVVRACALLQDFAQLPFGDLTLVGERGTSLSGGQRARVNLARAVYREAELYLLDDPLSAVDTHVGKHLFEECITKLLAGKTRILVTHQVQYLKDASFIAIMNNGQIEMQGTFTELLQSDVDYAQMLHLAEEEEEDVDELPDVDNKDRPLVRALRQLSRTSVRSRLSTQSQRSTRSSVQCDDDEEDDEKNEAPKVDTIERSAKGQVKGSLLFRYFLSGANICGLALIVLFFIGAQASASAADYFVGFWTNQEELRAYKETSTIPPTSLDGTTSDTYAEPMFTVHTYVYIYTAIISTLFFVAFTRSFSFYLMCMRCSYRLHNRMFDNIIQASMVFFNNNPSGRILNRFSKDLGSVDELLPKALLDASQILLSMVGSIAVAISVDWIFSIPVAVLLTTFFLARRFYLKTATDVKRLESMTRSPVFTHLNASIQGLSTIRAFGAQDVLRQEFDNHQDLHSSAWYMFISSSCSFGMFLDMMGLMFVTVVVFSFLTLDQTVYGGDVGLAITQSMAMTGMVQYGIRQSAEVDAQLMSVERILEYMDLPKETDGGRVKGVTPDPAWPTEGRIELSNVWMRYAPDAPHVLKGLNLLIQPMEKVGIVGRTGAGKSSLIAALFRLAEVEGSVLLDGIDAGEVPLQLLRSRISIIPQDPVLFSGTLRKNLDPFNEYPDFKLWSALEDVELRDAASESAGLDMMVSDGGSNFSVGQRQLVCLARAILRGNRVLMLDEATANVDPQTDALIQRTIRTKFATCTVLTVAHRLNTIMDSDRVLVMDSGRAAEFNHPYMLLQKKGIFYSLVHETGQHMAETLARIAEESYMKKKNV